MRGHLHLLWALMAAASAAGVSGCDAFMSTGERLERARLAMAQGDPRAAVIDVRNVLKKEPDSVEANLLLARLALQLGDPGESEASLERAISHGAEPAAVGELAGEVRLALGRPREVLEQIDSGELVIAEPARSILRGRALTAAGRANEAVQVFRDVLDREPESVPASLGLAEALLVARQSDAAMEVLRSLIESAPQSAEAHLLQGRIFLRRGQYAQAEAALERVRSLPTGSLSLPRRALAMASLVEAQLAQGKIEPAKASYGELARLAPRAAITRLLGARIDLAQGEYLQGIAELQRLVTDAPDFVQARMLLGAAHLSQGNLYQAERHLENVVAVAPDNLEARKLLARVRLQLDQPDAALRVLTPALARDSTDSELYMLLGTAQLHGGDSELGLDTLEQGLRANPDDEALRLDLAAAYVAYGRHEAAIELLQSTPQDRQSVRHRSLLIAAIAASRGPRAATSELEKLVAERPRDPEILYVASMYFLSQREIERARAYISRALEIAPRDARVLTGLARMEIAAGNLAAAESALRRALDANATNTGVRLELADLLLRRGDNGAALELLEEARTKSPSSIEIRLALAQVYLTRNDLARARPMLDEAVGIAPNRADVVNATGRLLLDAQRFDEALARFRRATELDGNNPLYWLNTGRAQLAMDQSAAARESLEKALALKPDWLPAVSTLVLLELRTGGVDAALARAQDLRKRHPSEPAAAVLEGDVYMAGRRYREAALAYEDAERMRPDAMIALKRHEALRLGALEHPEEPLLRWLGLRPEDYRVRVVLAQFYLTTGRLPPSIEEFEAVLRQAPQNIVVLNNLAWLYQQVKDNRAEEMARRAYDLAPSNPDVADTYGWILLGKNDTTRALPVLEKAARAAKDNAEIQYHYAAALARAGKRGEAREILRRLLEAGLTFPGWRDAEKLLAELQS